MGYITELKSKSKRTRYKAVINICKKSDGIEYFDTQTFSIKVLAKAWLKREEDRLEKNPHLLSTDKDAVASAACLWHPQLPGINLKFQTMAGLRHLPLRC